jgi:hypothetical protein
MSPTLRVGLWVSTFVLLSCTAGLSSMSLSAGSQLVRLLSGGVWVAGTIQIVLAPLAVARLVRSPAARNLLDYLLTGMGTLGAVLFLRMCWLAFH